MCGCVIYLREELRLFSIVIALTINIKLFLLSGIGMNAVPGGHFPLPSAVANVMSLIPPPGSFQVNIIIIMH